VLDEDREEHVSDLNPAQPEYFDFACSAWNVDAKLARAICVVFNGLPHQVRAAYWSVVVQGKSFHRVVAEGCEPPQLVEERLKRALLAMSTLNDPGGVDAHEGDGHAG
jgi:hypothetical protein